MWIFAFFECFYLMLLCALKLQFLDSTAVCVMVKCERWNTSW